MCERKTQSSLSPPCRQFWEGILGFIPDESTDRGLLLSIARSLYSRLHTDRTVPKNAKTAGSCISILSEKLSRLSVKLREDSEAKRTDTTGHRNRVKLARRYADSIVFLNMLTRFYTEEALKVVLTAGAIPEADRVHQPHGVTTGAWTVKPESTALLRAEQWLVNPPSGRARFTRWDDYFAHYRVRCVTRVAYHQGWAIKGHGAFLIELGHLTVAAEPTDPDPDISA